MELVIKEGTSRSDALLLPNDMIGINTPINGWNIAPLCFRVSKDGVNYIDMLDGNGELVAVALSPPGSYMEVPPPSRPPPGPPGSPWFPAGSYVILVSGTPDQVVPQDMDRVFPVWTSTSGGKGAAQPLPAEQRTRLGMKEEERPHRREEQGSARGSDRHK